ncbi:MAG: Holliday junction branch migration protein RuvA [Patescibacteria group bacterium]|nr:Holliday junction branch migration protein RuvA [Patescibacteria group bacterium]
MISYLHGKIKIKTDKFVILEVNNIGYKIFAPQNVLESLNAEGEEQELFIHHHVSEDREELYGFLNFQDLDFFELLMSVSGIGPKSALGVMAQADTQTLKTAIITEDKSIFTKVSGVGQKTAERIILELKTKIPADITLGGGNQDLEALDALIHLGYSQKEAREALRQAPRGLILASERIKWALQNLGK